MRKFKIRIDGEEYIVEVEEIDGDSGAGSKVDSGTDVKPDSSITPPPGKTDSGSGRQRSGRNTPPNSSRRSGSSVNQNGDSKGALTAPMAGKVLKINVTEGTQVTEGDVLIVLEAMKMENNITAPSTARVQEIRTAQGDNVEAGEVLLKLE